MGLEWLCLLVPLAMTVYVYIKRPGQLVWWELLLTAGVCVLALFFARSMIVLSLGEDWEYQVEVAVEAKHEPAQVSISAMPVRAGTSTSLRVRPRFESARWTLVGREGSNRAIDEATFEGLSAKWESKRREVDKLQLIWPKTPDTAVFITSKQGYVNPLQATRRAYGLPEVGDPEKESFGLHDYPEQGEALAVDMILGKGGLRRAEAELMLKQLNATAGRERNFQCWILLFPGQPIDAARLQEALWEGGNRHEFVICIGTDRQDRVSWSRAFSWTPERSSLERVRVEVVRGEPLDLVKIVEGAERILAQSWKPPDLSSHTIYDVEVPIGGLIAVTILTGLTGAAVLWCVATNDFKRAGSESAGADTGR